MTIDPLRYPQPRSRHHTNPQFYLPLSELHVVPSQYPPVPSALDWQTLYASGAAPRALDIGCGWGRFLIDLAEQRPQVNLLGIELRQQAVEWINGVIDGERLPNARALYYSVANGLPFIADASVEEVYYFFPDPWFKKRHGKRRAFTSAFLRELQRVMVPGGTLFLMTDVPEVDAAQCEILMQSGSDAGAGPGVFEIDDVTDGGPWLPVMTDHELYCRRRGFAYTRKRCSLRP
ncbi:MAG: tRNA (guanine(46)-N(7))-methyltransferase TrmB [Candidatus Kapaibacterium sp.]